MRLTHCLFLVVALGLSACGEESARKLQEQIAKGRALIAEGKHDAAAVELARATEMDRHSTEAWLQLGHAYRGLQRNDDALAAYVAAKRADRHSVAPYLAHAMVQVELGRIAEATTELNLVVEMDPKNLEGLIQLGRVSQMPQKLPDGSIGVSRASLERAELNLQAATTLAPQNAEAQFELVRVSAKLGKREQAAAALATLRSLAGTDAGARKRVPEAEAALKTAGG